MILSDIQIRDEILRELRWNNDIDIDVHDGIVRLTGATDSCMFSLIAEEAARRIYGVVKVMNEVKLKPRTGRLTDEEISEAVRHVLEWNSELPYQRIRSIVSNGWVALDGQVDHISEREEAERLVLRLASVCGVYNGITVKGSGTTAETVRPVPEGISQRTIVTNSNNAGTPEPQNQGPFPADLVRSIAV